MTQKKQQWKHTALVALFSFLAVTGEQLASGTLSLTKSVIVGLIIGAVSRFAGAYLSAQLLGNGTSTEP